MRWTTFVIMTYITLAIQEGLRTLLMFNEVSPSLVMILMVFIALHAPRSKAAWAALMLGLLTDLKPLPLADPLTDLTVIGPGCLGYLAATSVVLQLRAMVFRESAMSLAALVLLAGVFAHLVIVALLTMRGLPWPLGEPIQGWNVADQLVERFLEVLYTAIWALPMGVVLNRLIPLWDFVLVTPSRRRPAGVRSER